MKFPSARWLIDLGLVLACCVLLYFHFKPDPAPPGVHMPAATAPELKREETVPVLDAAPPQVYKPAAKAKLKLPPAVQADAAQRVVASIRTSPDERPHTVTTVLDAGTGEFTSYDRADPLPWIAVRTTTHVSAYYGLKNGGQTVRVQGQQEFLRVKALHFEAIAAADIGSGAPDTFVGVGVRASW